MRSQTHRIMTPRIATLQSVTRRIVMAAAASLLLALPAAAQDKWPSKPVNVVVPFAAGGNTDVLARIFADRLTLRLGQAFVIENRTGAGGSTGLAAIARAAPDGYTIGVGTSGGLEINPVLLKDKIPYNVDKDFTFIYGIASQPNLWVVHPSVPAKTLPELITWLKANPDTPYATSGIGTSQHLCGEILAQGQGLQMAPVAYRASNQSLQDLIAGQIKVACDNFSSAIEQVKAGTLRGIAVTSATKYPFAPEIAAVGETHKGLEQTVQFGFLAPAGLPADVTKKLTDELTAIGKLPEVRTALEKFGVVQTETPGPEYAASLKAMREFYGTIIEKAGIKVP